MTGLSRGCSLAWLIGLALLLFGVQTALAQPVVPVQVRPEAATAHLGHAVAVYTERGSPWDAADLLDGANAAERLTTARDPPNLGYPRHPTWAVLALRNDSDATIERLLVLWRGATHQQTALIRTEFDDGSPRQERLSDARELDTRHSVIALTLPPHSTTRIAARIETATSLSLDYRLIDPEALAHIDRIDYWFFGLLAGMVFAIAIYVLALYAALREPLYLYFSGFAFLNLVYQVHIEGYAYLLWPIELAYWANLVGTYSGAGFTLLNALFVSAFLDLPRTQPRAYRWVIQPMLAMLLSVYVLFPLAPWLANTVAALGTVLTTIGLMVIVYRGAWLVAQSRSFALAIVGFFVSGIVHLLKRAGVLPDLQVLALGLQLGSAITVLLFAVAVLQRIRNIVEQNRSAQQRYAEQLETDVRARTSELTQAKEEAERALQQLQATQQQLVQSEKLASLGQLVAGVAHEVNTPLGVALTASTFLSDRTLGVTSALDARTLGRGELRGFLDEAASSARMIERNLGRAAHLIASFKQVSVDRTSDGRRPFVLDIYLRELIDSLQLTWKRRPITLGIDCPPKLELDSFPGALGQVLTNLIQNALLHAFEPDQPGHMQVSVDDLGSGLVAIRFADNGKGVDAAALARIFEPFYTTKRNQGGTGLGLHIAWNLVVQKLGGEIRAVSTPGQGLQFIMRIPRSAPGTPLPAVTADATAP